MSPTPGSQPTVHPLSQTAVEILFALAAGDQHGYGIMQVINRRGTRALTLGPGTLYRTIQGLLGERLITEVAKSTRDDRDPRRRTYRLTATGRQAVARETRHMREMIRLAAKLEPRPGRA